MDKVKRIKELTEQLNQYRDYYYNNSESKISDHEYDNLFDELKNLEEETGIIMSNSPTQTVGYEVKSKLEKVKHSHPMLSLDKTKSIDDLKKFAGNKDCILMCKMDGLTVLLTYEMGELIQAETRGNGEEGEIITHNARVFENIPLHIDYTGHLEVEGEAIITYDDFEKINNSLPEGEKYKNPRNLVSGSVRQLDSSIAAQRHIKFIAWKVPKIEDSIKSDNLFLFRLIFAKNLGFDIVPFFTYSNNTTDKENCKHLIENLKKQAKIKGYPIDGLVMAYNDISYGESLGTTGHHPKYSIAYKFYDEVYPTRLLDVEWTIGKTGTLTPTAVFEPVEIEGSTVERASIHNVSIMQELGIVRKGQIINVYKANCVIPQVDSVEPDNIEITDENMIIPTEICPICGSDIEIIQENDTKVLMCTNPDCKGKLLGKLVHFCSKNAINVEGMSEVTLQFLIDKGWVNSFQDLYHLDKHKDEWSKCEGFGKRSVEKLLESIEKSRNTTLMRVLYAQSIPLIGKSASKDIDNYCNRDVQIFINFMNTDYDFIVIDGFGVEMQKSLSSWWKINCDDFLGLLQEFTFEKIEKNNSSVDLSSKTFVITGSLVHYKNRDELVDLITLMGGKVSGSVSAKTSYLINNDTQSSSSKNQKAKKLNIPIISEEDFIKMIS